MLERNCIISKYTPRIFIDEGKNTNWSQIREAGPDKSHIESCKNPVWNAGQRDRAGWVSRILYLYSGLITSHNFFSAGARPY